MTRFEIIRRLRELAKDLREHLPYPGAERAALQLDAIASDIIKDLWERP